MKKTGVLLGCMSLLLQAGPAKVVPAEHKLQPVSVDRRPHSAPEKGAGLKNQTSFSRLKFVADEQRKRSSTISTSDEIEKRSGSVSPGVVQGTFCIKGAKGRPVKATIVIGGKDKEGAGEEKKESPAVMSGVGSIAEEHVAETTENEEDEDTCMEKMGACCSKFLKFFVGLVACL